MWQLLKVSGGGILQNLIATSSWILLVRIIAVSGPAALAGARPADRAVFRRGSARLLSAVGGGW